MPFRYRLIRYRYLQGSPEEIEHFLRRLWEQSRFPLLERSTAWRPPTDVYETAAGLVVRLELAGLREDDVDVSLYEDALVVTGHRSPPAESLRYHEAGIRYGEFRCEVYLPRPVDPDAVSAVYQDGFLVITLPRPGDGREVEQ